MELSDWLDIWEKNPELDVDQQIGKEINYKAGSLLKQIEFIKQILKRIDDAVHVVYYKAIQNY